MFPERQLVCLLLNRSSIQAMLLESSLLEQAWHLSASAPQQAK
jgi:hypothetical protein